MLPTATFTAVADFSECYCEFDSQLNSLRGKWEGIQPDAQPF